MGNFYLNVMQKLLFSLKSPQKNIKQSTGNIKQPEKILKIIYFLLGGPYKRLTRVRHFRALVLFTFCQL